MTPSTARALWLVFGPVASAFLGFAAFCLFVFGLGHYTETDPRATSTEVFYRSMGFPAMGAVFIVGTLVSFWRAWRLSKFLSMPTVALQAHFDGERIVLDEPFDLPANVPLMVTVIAPDDERSEWAALGAQGLARAYGDDEPEYTAADLKPQ